MPKPILHGRDHAPGGADPIPNWPTGGAGLPNAMVWKQTNTDVTSGTNQQIDFDSTKFATTDATVFEAGTNLIKILTTGLYIALVCVVNDNTPITDKLSVSVRWVGGAGSDELIVPRSFAFHDSGGTMFAPNGDDPLTSDRIIAMSWAYVNDVSAGGSTVKAYYYNHDSGTIHLSQRLLTVIQVQPIADLSAFAAYPS